MQSTFEREKLAEGVYFSHVSHPKFYSNRLTIHLITPLCAQTVTENAVVPSILRLGCRSCPDFTALNRRLGLLYGAQLSANASRFADRQILSLSIRGIDGRVALHGEDMVRELCALLCEVALDPLLEDGAFTAANTALERQNLIDTIESEMNDKRVYAQNQCYSLLFEGQARGLRPTGSVERAREITPSAAYAAYRRLLEGAQIELMFAGSGDSAKARTAFAACFEKLPRAYAASAPSPQSGIGARKERTEAMEISQSKLVMGFHCAPGEDAFALRMMSAMYGGTPFSKLFLNVRERLSLCYYCSARYDRGNGILLVSSGVEQEKKEAAYEEILRQLQALQDGDFTDEELHNTLLIMNTGFAATNDSLSALEGWYLTQTLAGQQNSPEQECAAMQRITRADVVRAANSVELGAVYFLTGGEHAPQAQGGEKV